MTHSLTPNSQPSDADLVYELLKCSGRPVYYLNLIKEVLVQQGLPQDPRHISSILTQINLDTRFAFVGNGEWGLKVWVPTRGARRLPTITLMNKSLAYDDEDNDGSKEPFAGDELDDLEENEEDQFTPEEDFQDEPEEKIIRQDRWS